MQKILQKNIGFVLNIRMLFCNKIRPKITRIFAWNLMEKMKITKFPVYFYLGCNQIRLKIPQFKRI